MPLSGHSVNFMRASVPVADGLQHPVQRPGVGEREIRADVRAFADRAFATIQLTLGAPVWEARAYYFGIRIGYPVFRLFNPDN